MFPFSFLFFFCLLAFLMAGARVLSELGCILNVFVDMRAGFKRIGVYFERFLMAGARVFKWLLAFLLICARILSELGCIDWQGCGF